MISIITPTLFMSLDLATLPLLTGETSSIPVGQYSTLHPLSFLYIIFHHMFLFWVMGLQILDYLRLCGSLIYLESGGKCEILKWVILKILAEWVFVTNFISVGFGVLSLIH